MPAKDVKAYVKRNKNDAADAEAICEAVRRPTMRFVQIKSVEQQGQSMLHRARDLLMRQRTQLINALRAHMAELGIVAVSGARRGQGAAKDRCERTGCISLLSLRDDFNGGGEVLSGLATSQSATSACLLTRRPLAVCHPGYHFVRLERTAS
jgi:transposase